MAILALRRGEELHAQRAVVVPIALVPLFVPVGDEGSPALHLELAFLAGDCHVDGTVRCGGMERGGLWRMSVLGGKESRVLGRRRRNEQYFRKEW
jgi:hypothetical protein